MSSQWFYQRRLEHPASPAYPAISPPSFPCRPESSEGQVEGLMTEKQAHHGTGNESTRGLTRGRSRAMFDMLPDVALLEMFDFYLDRDKEQVEAWYTLVHVCRKWRNVVLESPRRLNLQLRCTGSTPVREMIDAWPLLPIVLSGYGRGVDNIIAALELNDRIRQLELDGFPSSQMEKVFAALQQPFPALTSLRLRSGETVPVVPALFLGGSAPQLQTLILRSIPFPGLPKLLMSATHLVTLHLSDIPDLGYVSPEAIVTCLAVLTKLKLLEIGFKSSRIRPDRRRRPLLWTRTLLPALIYFEFKGASEYLDDFVARINAPILDDLHITFFHQLIFDTPHLTQFISRTSKFKAYNTAHVEFSNRRVWVTTTDRAFTLAMSCRQSDWQLSSLAQIWGSVFIHMMEHVWIFHDHHRSLCWQDDIETSQWLELLYAFIAVKDLYISRSFTPFIVPTLQELVGERVTEVLPALETIFLGVSAQESIRKFITARRLAGRPIDISYWTF